MTFHMSPRRSGRVRACMQLSKLAGRSCVAEQLASGSIMIRNGPEMCGTLHGGLTSMLARLREVRGNNSIGSRLLSLVGVVTSVLNKLGRMSR